MSRNHILASKNASRKTAVAKAQGDASHAPSTPPSLGFDSLFGFLAFLSLCAMLFLAPPLFSGFWPSSYEYWPQAMFLALTACACVLLALAPVSKIKSQRSSAGVLLALFFAWCAFSVFNTVYLHDSLLEIARVAGVVAWLFIARSLLGDAEYYASRATWLLAFVALGIALVCVPAILDFFKTHNPRQFGTFYNPNLFANYCALALPLVTSGVLALWRKSRRSSSSIVPVLCGLVVFAIIVLGLFLTSSKGGLLATLCGLLVFALAVFKAKGAHVRAMFQARRGAVFAVALVVLIGGGVLFSQTILPRLSTNIQNDHSTMFRYYTWRGTLRMAAAQPWLGFGPGSFPSAYTCFAETGYTRTAHELWLQLAAESGFPALLLLLAACGASMLSGWRELQTDNWIFAAGALGALTAFFIHGLTDAGWSIISIAVLAMFALALQETGNRKQETSVSSLQPPVSSLSWFWLLAALLVALGSWVTQRAQSGEDLRRESRELMARGAASTGLEKAQEATTADPYSARLLTNLAETQEVLGQDAQLAYEKVTTLQSTRGLNWLNLAEYGIEKRGLGNSEWPAKTLYRAVWQDPNDTEIRLAYGQWKLKNHEVDGWKDIEYVASLKDKPYGKYPATPEMVDLNYARAFALLAARDFKNKKFDATKKWVARGLEVIAEAREWEPQRRAMEQATKGAIDSSREQTMNELETQLKALQEKIS